jgi:hypothetical protein
MKRTNWMSAGSLAVALIYVVYIILHVYPIKFHQRVRTGGVTMSLPVLWKRIESPSKSIILTHEFEPSSSVLLMDRSQWDPTAVPWTMEAARQEQHGLIDKFGGRWGHSNARTFDVSSGRYTSVCAEATIFDATHGVNNSQFLLCSIVGTNLQLSFQGDQSSESGVQTMLASLT